MSIGKTTYNERSWAIDLIGHLKRLAAQDNRSIKDAGGEQSINVEGGILFPDVLLFGDRETARILQGWELKMPDTKIDDYEFRKNAQHKAGALGLDSFLLWNVSHAHLYVRDVDSDTFSIAMQWDELADITTRTSVIPNRARWEKLAEKIIGDLNDRFDRGVLEGRQFIDAYRSGGITALIMENSGLVSDVIVEAAKRDSGFRSEMVLWWDKHRAEYGGVKMETVLAQAIISNWIGKLLFAQILREKDRRAHGVADIADDTTPSQALELFRKLSKDCNFWTIFSDSLGLSVLPDQPWNQLKQLNRLLSDLRIGSVDQVQLSDVLEATVEVAIRKLRGQYPTPIELARLLVQLCMRNTVDDRILDPCCGSGTIVRAAMEQKLSADVPADKVSASIFASDQDPQAIQIATFALAKPDMMHMPLRVFQRDAFTLGPETVIDFQDPTNGAVFSEVLGQFDAIVSNLPFVAQAGGKRYDNAIKKITASIGVDGQGFSGRADLAAYLPFALHPLLKDNGRLGIIITNAWLGTDWGDALYNSLGKYYSIKSVITSGAGRWFQNSNVVTNILILEKKTDSEQSSGDIKFIVLTRPIQEIADDEAVQISAAQIEQGQTQNETMTIRAVSPNIITRFRKYGLGGNAQFVNCDWILNLPLIPLKNLFTIKRGERRGMNALFYPKNNHGIEAEYIRPLAKGPADFKHLRGKAIREAFCCSRTEDELSAMNHEGALKWINRFNTPQNIKKLSNKKTLWYEMDSNKMTELAMFINYGNRLFVVRLDPPAFVDQRLVRLDAKKTVDIDLCHALLNSTIGMFIIEGLGFGRGLGALDLNKDRLEDYMHILDPDKLDEQKAKNIKNAFSPLLKREILDVADELEQKDRQNFDDVVINAFGVTLSRNHLYESLQALVGIRLAAND